MAAIVKKMRLVNPGRKAPTAKQLAARAKFAAMVRARSKNPSIRGLKKKLKKYASPRFHTGVVRSVKLEAKRRRAYKESKLGNPGEIITIGLNPGRVKGEYKSMARRKRRTRKNPIVRSFYRRKARRNPARRRTYARRRNYVARRRHVRRHNPVYLRRRRFRRNPSFGGLKTTGVMVAGVIGGAIITKKVVDVIAGMWPAAGSGFMKYITTGAVASILGYGVSKFAKSPSLGSGIALGGYTLVGLQIANDMIPGFSGYSPFGVSGMGVIMPSSFYTPQVPVSGSMTQFVTPAAVAAAMPVMKGMKGIGNVMSHPGRTRLTRVA